MTNKDSYPLPVINDLFHNLINARFFSKLDFDSGYYQLRMDEASRKYTAFACEFGFFEWNVLPMGLKNAGATFQREMDEMLGDLIGKCCNVYMDDIIIYSNTIEEHLEHLRLVLGRIRHHKMRIKKKKCEFFKTEIEYLGHTISTGVLKPSQNKCLALFQYPRPSTLTQILSFLGLASYYRKFIRNFATTASPLYRISTNTKKFSWNEECEKAFTDLRTCLTVTDCVLLLPQFDKPFKLETDASNYGIGAVLSQQVPETGEWKPVAYFAKHLSKAERNYSASERELLAVVKSIEFFKQYLYGQIFTVVTDHQPLQWLMTVKNPAARQMDHTTRTVSIPH